MSGQDRREQEAEDRERDEFLRQRDADKEAEQQGRDKRARAYGRTLGSLPAGAAVVSAAAVIAWMSLTRGRSGGSLDAEFQEWRAAKGEGRDVAIDDNGIPRGVDEFLGGTTLSDGRNAAQALAEHLGAEAPVARSAALAPPTEPSASERLARGNTQREGGGPSFEL